MVQLYFKIYIISFLLFSVLDFFFQLRASFHEKYYISQNFRQSIQPKARRYNLHPEKNQKQRRADAVDSY